VLSSLPFYITSHIRLQNFNSSTNASSKASLVSQFNMSEMKYENAKPEDTKPEPEKPANSLGCLESFFGVFKNLFGCIKNAEEAYTHAPPQLSQQLSQLQPPQQVSSMFLGKRCWSSDGC
jgi:hypothetical protein